MPIKLEVTSEELSLILEALGCCSESAFHSAEDHAIENPEYSTELVKKSDDCDELQAKISSSRDHAI